MRKADKHLSCKADDTLETLGPKLLEKTETASTAIHHVVGPYTIRNGQYGLYMYKATAGNRKPTFVSLPEATPWSSLTPEGAEELYKHCLAAKKEKVKEKTKKKF